VNEQRMRRCELKIEIDVVCIGESKSLVAHWEILRPRYMMLSQLLTVSIDLLAGLAQPWVLTKPPDIFVSERYCTKPR
jgi:hypothetical protein